MAREAEGASACGARRWRQGSRLGDLAGPPPYSRDPWLGGGRCSPPLVFFPDAWVPAQPESTLHRSCLGCRSSVPRHPEPLSPANGVMPAGTAAPQGAWGAAKGAGACAWGLAWTCRAPLPVLPCWGGHLAHGGHVGEYPPPLHCPAPPRGALPPGLGPFKGVRGRGWWREGGSRRRHVAGEGAGSASGRGRGRDRRYGGRAGGELAGGRPGQRGGRGSGVIVGWGGG